MANRKSGFVAIIGRPNAGKSTLLNAVLGTELSIVTPKAQTTREKVLGIHTEKQGQIVFMDTPGIHKAKPGGINEYMVTEARDALDSPSLIWYMVDPKSALFHEAAVIDLLAQSRSPLILILNKMDLGKNDPFEAELVASLNAKNIKVSGVFKISALKKKGVRELLVETWRHIPHGELFYPDEEQLSDRPTRFFVGEKVREQLYRQLGEELPYSCAVEIELFDEKVKPPRIEAVIHVERESQKGIIIGKGGLKIKEIGKAARAEIEKFMGTHVFLGLKVKVLKEWTRDAQALERMGYHFTKPGKKSSRNRTS